MPKTIYKFGLDVTEVQNISIQKGGEILTVQMQGGIPQLWALVDPEAEKEIRTIHIAGTGHFLSDDLTHRYIGTVQLHAGILVLHVFEVLK